MDPGGINNYHSCLFTTWCNMHCRLLCLFTYSNSLSVMHSWNHSPNSLPEVHSSSSSPNCLHVCIFTCPLVCMLVHVRVCVSVWMILLGIRLYVEFSLSKSCKYLLQCHCICAIWYWWWPLIVIVLAIILCCTDWYMYLLKSYMWKTIDYILYAVLYISKSLLTSKQLIICMNNHSM